jgi:hypothetical protein
MKIKNAVRIAVMMLLFFGYLSCNKRLNDDKSFEDYRIMQSKFFQETPDINGSVLKVLKYLEKENIKIDFVLSVSKNVGFPVWNKSTVTTKSQHYRSTESILTQDSVVLVPLVPDNENFVNGFLAATISGNDIAVELYKGSDYDNFSYGKAEGGSITAEKVAIQIMSFDYSLFGFTEFQLTDSKLFNEDMGLSSSVHTANRIGRVNFSNSGTFATEGCIHIEVTWCDNSNSCKMNGCDWEDCPAGTCGSYLIKICSSSGGGDNGAGFGPSVGNGPTSIGGSSGGSASGGGGLGWEPMEDEMVLPRWISDSLPTPCIKSALQKISSGTRNTFFRKIYNTFNTSSSLVLNIQEVDSIPGAYAATDSPSQISLGTYINIDLNTLELKKCSQEFISYTLIHEVAHAAMYANIISWDTTNTQHENMISTYLDQMANTLKASYSTLTLKEAYSICFFGFKNAIDGKTADPRFLDIMLNQIRAKLNDPNLSALNLDSMGRNFARTGNKGLRNCN